MDVRYERPMPDLSYTITAPLVLDFGDWHGVGIDRWCLEGLHAPAELRGASGEGWLTIPFQGFGITFRVHLRYDRDSELLRFERLGAREERVLRNFYRALVTGRAVAMETMITAMDAPVPLVSMAQTPQEAAQEAEATMPRAVRALAAVVAYGVLAFLAYSPILQALTGAPIPPGQPPVEIVGR